MDSLPISTERFVANLALGMETPGEGVRITTDGPIRGHQVGMLTTLYRSSPHLPANQGLARGPLRAVMELTDAERNAWLGYSIDLFGLDFSGTELPAGVPSNGRPTWTINWRPEDSAPPSTVLIFRQWTRYKNAPLRAEQLWLAEDREQSMVRVLEPDATYSPAVIERAFRGIALMRGNSLLPAIERANRPGPNRETEEAAQLRIIGGLNKLASQKYPPLLTRAALGDAIGGLQETGVSELNNRAKWRMSDVKKLYAEILTNLNKPKT